MTLVLAAFAIATVAACAQQNPKELVTQMVHNELHSSSAPHYWMFLDHNVKHGKTVVDRVVETRESWLRWPVSVDAHPPSDRDRSTADQTIKRLVNDPAARENDRKKIDEDSKKAESLLKILPDAFIFEPAGENNGSITLHFRPNPNYSPPSKEAKVFHAMAGELVINAKDKRLEKLSGKLTHDVDFGWGILGKIRKGGTFAVEQSQEAPGDWELTKLDVHINGKALFFHTISEQQQESMTDFQPVPTNIGLKEAAVMVKRGESQQAKK